MAAKITSRSERNTTAFMKASYGLCCGHAASALVPFALMAQGATITGMSAALAPSGVGMTARERPASGMAVGEGRNA